MTDLTELLIQPEELAAELGRDDLRIVDATVFLEPAGNGYRAVSGIEKYRQRHLPGAAFMDQVRTFSDTSTGLGFSRLPPDALADALGHLGVSADHRVVVYSSGHMMWATRAFWLLRYAGHTRVSVLDGGLHGWQAAGLELRSGDEHYPPARFAAEPQPGIFVDLPEVRDAQGNPRVCTVNALSPEVYAGTGDMHYGRRGHIPGSRNLHYDRLMAGHHFRPVAELREALAETGMLDAPRVITYCGGGISATVDAFACLLAGQADVAVYDGSMAEWVRDENLPLTTGSEP